MAIETVLTCPLGSKCEEVRDNKIHRCAWFTQMRGTDPQTGEDKDESACAMQWMPLLLVENTRQQVRTTSTVESFRDASVKQAEETRKVMVVAHALAARAPQLNTIPPGSDQPLIAS